MIDPELLKLVRCPLDGQPLAMAESSLVDELNRRIAAGQVRDRTGELVDETILAALVTADRRRLYPVRDHIPTLIPAESIPLTEDSP